MAANNFATCLAHTLEFEGGYSNHPSDPGGATMKGVIQRVYDAYRDKKGSPRQPVQYITDPELRDIYKTGYWDKVQGDILPAGLDLATFDYGVNSGPSRALQHLNATRGSTVERVKALCARRLSFVRGLGTFSVFGRGWTRRITTIEARSVKMAMAGPPERIEAELKREAKDAQSKANQQGGGATVTGVGGWSFSDVTGVLIGVAVVLVAVWLGYRAWINYQRAKAYAEVANEDAR